MTDITVVVGDTLAQIQNKLDSLPGVVGDRLLWPNGATFDFGGGTLVGKSNIKLTPVTTTDPVTITNGSLSLAGLTNVTVRGHDPGGGFIFNGGFIDCSGADHCKIINNAFSNQPSREFAGGSAIDIDAGSVITIANCDFTNVGGTTIGIYSADKITIDGNHFFDCVEVISLQGPLPVDPNVGRNISIKRCVFTGTKRAAIEIGPNKDGQEMFTGLVVTDNFFDAFNPMYGESPLLPISCVGLASSNTTIKNNYMRRGPLHPEYICTAIEIAGTGECSGNTSDGFSYGALTYASGWNVHDNKAYREPGYLFGGWSNNGSGTGTFANNTTLTSPPTTPAWPTRIVW